jgi:hypothetical protein
MQMNDKHSGTAVVVAHGATTTVEMGEASQLPRIRVSLVVMDRRRFTPTITTGDNPTSQARLC